MAESFDIAIVGAGKVGTALNALASISGLRVALVRRGEAIPPVELVLLTVNDDAIEPLCNQLADAKAFKSGAVVAHCSGALGSDALISAREQCGCHVGSMHPLQTFPTVEAAVETLPKAYCFCEGDAPAVEALYAFAARIGSKAVVMDSGGKALYHAAAVMACNYLTTLLECGLELMAAAGVDPKLAATALLPLVQATLDNNAAMGPAAALTGPIARGDVATVARHVAALRQAVVAVGPSDLPPRHPGATLALYRAAGLRTIELALKKGTIDAAKADALRKILSEGKED
ncbi:MAG: Rossmann-like and DUF2520 domain-containing protein [Planctomycetaceae bacterium]|nr:DUF2520 domain-containing protein [Planctomycetaceae bacterium]